MIVMRMQSGPHTCNTRFSFRAFVKGEVSRKFDFISKPKTVCLLTQTKKNCRVLLKIITPVQ